MLGFIRLAGSAGLPTGAARMAKYKAITTTTMKRRYFPLWHWLCFDRTHPETCTVGRERKQQGVLMPRQFLQPFRRFNIWHAYFNRVLTGCGWRPGQKQTAHLKRRRACHPRHRRCVQCMRLIAAFWRCGASDTGQAPQTSV